MDEIYLYLILIHYWNLIYWQYLNVIYLNEQQVEEENKNNNEMVIDHMDVECKDDIINNNNTLQQEQNNNNIIQNNENNNNLHLNRIPTFAELFVNKIRWIKYQNVLLG